MTGFIFVEEALAIAIHEAQLAEHGGITGLRDLGLLQSALARPLNLSSYGEADLPALAAALAFGIARNHPFLDGNKRTAFVCSQLFLRLNGRRLNVDHVDATLTFLKLAAGEVSEEALAAWMRRHLASFTG
jgi:death-on-curing protein